MSKRIAIVMGSAGDFPKVQPAIMELKRLGIPFDVRVMSAHRTPEMAAEFAARARQEGFGAIIAAAGKAAHLAGVLAAYTTLPVIGIPISQPQLDGLDALLATVQMPTGVPVATVAIDGSANAALLAAQILSVEDEPLARKLDFIKKEMNDKVQQANREIQKQIQEL